MDLHGPLKQLTNGLFSWTKEDGRDDVGLPILASKAHPKVAVGSLHVHAPWFGMPRWRSQTSRIVIGIGDNWSSTLWRTARHACFHAKLRLSKLGFVRAQGKGAAERTTHLVVVVNSIDVRQFFACKRLEYSREAVEDDGREDGSPKDKEEPLATTARQRNHFLGPPAAAGGRAGAFKMTPQRIILVIGRRSTGSGTRRPEGVGTDQWKMPLARLGRTWS